MVIVYFLLILSSDTFYHLNIFNLKNTHITLEFFLRQKKNPIATTLIVLTGSLIIEQNVKLNITKIEN